MDSAAALGSADPPGASVASPPSAPSLTALGRAVVVSAVLEVGGLLSLSGRYGWHRDELYFRVAGQHPAWGYVDQPPLTPLIARAERELFGDILPALRVWPALVAGAVVVLTGLLTRELGGGRRAQALAAVGMALSPGLWLAGHLLTTATTDLLVWLVVTWLAVRAVRTDDTRWWLLVGAVLGVGLENKHLPLFLALAILAGLGLTRRRRHWASRHLWLGALLSLALFAPNLVWQAAHDWPQWRMVQAVRGSDSRTQYVVLQLLILNPALLPVEVAGMRRLWRFDRGRYRPLVWALALVELLFFVTGGKPYYPAALLVLLLAAGSVTAEERLAHRRQRPARAVLRYGALGGAAALLAPVVLPVLPLSAWAGSPWGFEDDARATVGWPSVAAQVASVVDRLPPTERAHAVVVTQNYGEAGALARFGHGLPPVVSGHNSYWFWGTPAPDRTFVVAVGLDRSQLGEWWRSVRLVATLTTPHHVDSGELGAQVFVCTGARAPWNVIWPRLRRYG